MALNFNCLSCNINQVIKISNVLNLPRNDEEKILKAVLKYLSTADYSKCNPEIMGEIWKIICNLINNSNPYRLLKNYYNIEIEKMHNEIVSIIEETNDKFLTCLKIAIVGNLIDFAAKHTFKMEDLKQRLTDSKNIQLTVDHSKQLYHKLGNTESLLYLGDNCGEIVLDKIFIKYIKQEFPNIKVFYGVRGKPIVNDVTQEDAQMVDMASVAEVIDNSDGSLGTVIEKTSEKFRKIFYNADIIISKGQGNYESLLSIDRDNIFFLFMAKCEPIAEILNIETMSIVCIENNIQKNKRIIYAK